VLKCPLGSPKPVLKGPLGSPKPVLKCPLYSGEDALYEPFLFFFTPLAFKKPVHAAAVRVVTDTLTHIQPIR